MDHHKCPTHFKIFGFIFSFEEKEFGFDQLREVFKINCKTCVFIKT